MGIVEDRGRYYWVKRVPKCYLGLALGKNHKPVTQVRQALHTDSLTEAKAKAGQIEVARLAEWEAIAAGDFGSARAHYEAALKLAQVRGFQYRTLGALMDGPVDEVLGRIRNLRKTNDPRVRTHNQNMTVAARAIAERKTVGDLS